MAENLTLTAAVRTHGQTADLKNGAVAVPGVTQYLEIKPQIAAFRRMVRNMEFDVCELASTTYMIARGYGKPFKALPVFFGRRFHHHGLVVRPDSGIPQPKDLEGKKVGVRAYTVTTGVWTRGVLQNEYGVDPSKVTWMVDDEEHVQELKLPDNVQHVPEGKSLASMMAAGEIQAGFLANAGIGREGAPREDWAAKPVPATDTYRELIPDAEEALRCPPKDKEPDLKVEKRADVTRCTMAGGCDFTIKVTNVGDGPYHGKIVLDEVTLPAGSTLDSGPNPPWVCVPGVTPMTCTHPVTTLNPGASVNLKLGFKPAGGWQGSVLRNCATYNYGASGKPLFGSQQNDRGCASIPICKRGDRNPDCRPPVDKKVDLILKKRARIPVCTPDGICYFVIDIINNGTVPYNGPLTVIDTYPGGAPASSTFGPSPPWTCGPNGPGQFRCDNAGIVLMPGASTPIVVKAVMPAGYQSDSVENCAALKPVPGEVDLTNNKACAKERFRHPNGGKPTLRITKVCNGSLAGAAVVSCRITVISLGTAAPTGPVRVNDAATLIAGGAPVQIQTVTPDGAEWACGAVPANALSCQIPGAVMTPGTSRHFDVTVSANGAFENCARGSYGPAPGDDVVYPIGQACAKGGGTSTISVKKTGDAECQPGSPARSRSPSPMTARPILGSGPHRRCDRCGWAWPAGRRRDHLDRTALRLLAGTDDLAIVVHCQPDARRRGKPCAQGHRGPSGRSPGQSAGQRQRPELRRRLVSRHKGARRRRRTARRQGQHPGRSRQGLCVPSLHHQARGEEGMLAGLRHERCWSVRVSGRHDVPQRPVLARRRRHPARSEALRPAQGPDPHRGRTLCLPTRHRARERRLRQDRQASVHHPRFGPDIGRHRLLLPERYASRPTGKCLRARQAEARAVQHTRSGS